MMRFALILHLALFLTSSAAAGISDRAASSPVRTELLPSTPDAVMLRHEFEAITPQILDLNGAACTTFPIEGEGQLIEPDMPLLPSVSRFIVVEPQSNLQLVITEDGEPQIIEVENPPFRIGIPELTTETGAIDTSGLYPPAIAEMSLPFNIRGVRLVKVTVYPMQYDFRTGNYLFHTGIGTEVRSVPGDAVNPVTDPVRRERSVEFLKFMQSFAVNGYEVGRDDPDRDRAPSNAGHYLIAYNEACQQFIAPYIEWRRKAGYKVDLLRISSGDATNAGTIERLIQERYDAYRNNGQDPFEYLLLVGDRNSYQYPPGASAVLESPIGTSAWPNAPHGEYLYATLDGNDDRPDVAFGRWPGGNADVLGLIVGRTLAYEATPFMDDTSWFRRGGVYSQHWGNSENSAWHISIHTNMRWAEEVLQSRGYNEVRFHERYQWDQYGHEVGPFLVRLLNDKSNILIGRAENYHFTNRDGGNLNFENDVRDNAAFPINLCTSGHGEWGAEIMYRRGSAGHLKGYVTTTFGWGGPMTGFQSAVALDLANAVALKDMPVGWGWTYALNHIEQYFPRDFSYQGRNIFAWARTDDNHFGDPGIKAWVGAPRVMTMEAPESVAPQTKLIEVLVHPRGQDTPQAGARVSLYAPGRIPAANEAGYATYSRFVSKTTLTDADGIARFDLKSSDTLVANTPLYITVTGDNIKPLFHQATIRAPEAKVEINTITYSEVAGNNDAFMNPGEVYEVNIVARNLGDNTEVDVFATITSSSPYITVAEENTTNFGDIESHQNADGNRPVQFTISESCPDGVARPILIPRLLIQFESEGDVWKSISSLDVRAPHLEFRSVVNGDVIPDSATAIDVVVANTGRIASGAMEVELRSLGQGVTVVDGISSLPSITPGRDARLNGGRFDISGNKVVVPGSRSRVYLICRTETGFIDSTYFSLQIMQPRAGAPTGPDKYGYICFDDTDTLWDIAPEYDWIEINPNVDNDFDGTRIDFQGRSEFDTGEARVIPLGFETRFYGMVYDSITVATNGFISMGNQWRVTNYCNYPMDGCIAGGVGMLAPFWDDLRFGQNSGIYYYYDEDDSRFIVEWYRMRPASGEADQTFQVILYDRSVWITETGDQDVVFQYMTIQNLANIRNGDEAWVTGEPYASVGISSPRGDTGINYTYANVYPVGAAPLQNRRAIRFTTAPRFRAGCLYGWVNDVANGAPMAGVTIFTKHGFVATTDEGGYWRIGEALADVPFEITAHIQGYNDSTYIDLQVAEGDSLEIDFGLLHPEFSPSTWSVSTRLDPDLQRQLNFTVSNTGNGPLFWNAEKRLLGDANAALWELRRRYNAGEITDDDRIEGVVFANERFYLAGSNGNDQNLVYILNREGELLDSMAQYGVARYGYKDLEWDGELIWGSGSDTVFGFTPDNQLVQMWRGPHNPTGSFAWDSDENILWMSGITTNIVACDQAGNQLDRVLDRRGLRINGLAYWPEDPDNHKLYMTASINTNPVTYAVYKMNTENGDTIRVFDLPLLDGATSLLGGWITNQFDVYSWVMMMMANTPADSGSDRIQIYQLDARKDWMDLDVWTGVLQTGESQEFVVDFNSTGLPDTLFEGEFLFRHNADSSRAHIMTSLDVIGPERPRDFSLMEPVDGDTITALPLHGDTLNVPEVHFYWEPTVDANHADSVITYIQWFSSGDVSVSFPVDTTEVLVNLDTLGLPLWFDRPLVWWVQAVSGPDTIESLQRFGLNILANAVDSPELLPVEFGLQSLYPNPFNGRTTIRFGADRPERTSLIAYDLSGRVAARLFDAVPTTGYHSITWDAADLASGVYLLRLESAGRVKLAKMALIK